MRKRAPARLHMVRGSGNIFADLGLPKDEAANLKMRSDLMIAIVDLYQKSGRFGISQARLNALMRGKIGLFSLDALVKIACRARLSVRLVVKKAA